MWPGAFRRPCILADIPACGSASTEDCDEGRIPPETLYAEEGPFGEWTDTTGGQRDIPIIRVRSVLYRDNPIVLGCLRTQTAQPY